ncbi:hypothetical protein A2801_02275 [Candidatus Woesebacteria bacterium RIFCSPHIGHO2_01_FULL_41_10]|uniref:DUF5659 domain-containing protein n=1 Tax=Candidatus Woesebacteria bacterium RIFCSPHIGHO2_01_FULL_41_10 TaxID=1802500 RepID=A0A1F7YQ04_9BACT|nr:MAG: hypothetical protein A2801_02275 [Candidatus Woesebacteria bacterium RIFCSPHIGHO2_01_FULL_41_10]
MNKDYSNRYFRTSNLYAAAFLFAKGLALVNIDKLTSTKSQFVFEDTPEREYLLQQYNFAPENSLDCSVDVRKFIFALKTLKERLYQQEI